MASRAAANSIEVPEAVISAFTAEAQKIIYLSGGINADSRVRLEIAADRLGLPREQVEPLVRQISELARSKPDEDPELVRHRDTFRRSLVKTFARQPRELLTLAQQEKLLDVAERKYKLPLEEARAIMHHVAGQQNIRVISQTGAEQYVAQLVRERLGDSTLIDDAFTLRLHTVGQQLGLSTAEVEQIIWQRAEINAAALLRQRQMSWLAVGGAVVAAVVVIGVLGLVLMGPGSDPTAAVDASDVAGVTADAGGGSAVAGGAGSSTGSATGGTATTTDPPTPDGAPPDEPVDQWIPVELVVALARARTTLPGYASAIESIRTSGPKDRAIAYRTLLDRFPRDLSQEYDWMVLEELLTGCLAFDPDRTAAAALRDGLLSVLPTEEKARVLPEHDSIYQSQFWAARVLAVGAHRAGLENPRCDEIITPLQQRLGAPLDVSLPQEKLARQAIAALSHRLYLGLVAGAAAQPRLAADLHPVLSRLSFGSLDQETREALDTDFLLSVLPSAGEDWRRFQVLINMTVLSADPLDVLKLVDLYESTESAELRKSMEKPILARVQTEWPNLKDESVKRDVVEAFNSSLSEVGDLDPAVVASIARKTFSAVPMAVATSGQQRWRNLHSQIDRDLAGGVAKADLPRLTRAVTAAQLATQACALAQGELGYATYDSLAKEGKIVLDRGSLGSGSGSAFSEAPMMSIPMSGVASRNEKDLERYLKAVQGYRRIQQVAMRLTPLNGLAQLSDRIPDVKPGDAATVAAYLLAAKSEDEHRQVVLTAARLARWNHVCLALADGMAETNLRDEHVAEIVSAALGRRVEADAGGQWRVTFAQQLLRKVMADLAIDVRRPVRTSGGDQMFVRAREALVEQYQTRARLLGLPPGAYRAADSPDALLRLLIEQRAASLSGKLSREQDRQLLERLPHLLIAAEYLGGDELSRTVALQRVWAELLAAEIASQDAALAADADALADGLAARDQAAGHLLDQLSDGEETELRLWLLTEPKS